MAKRGVTIEDMVDTLSNPKRVQKLTLRGKKSQRIGITGANKVTIIFEEASKVVITVYNYRTEYYKNKAKQRRNKNKLNLKRQFGNRIKS